MPIKNNTTSKLRRESLRLLASFPDHAGKLEIAVEGADDAIDVDVGALGEARIKEFLTKHADKDCVASLFRADNTAFGFTLLSDNETPSHPGFPGPSVIMRSDAVTAATYLFADKSDVSDIATPASLRAGEAYRLSAELPFGPSWSWVNPGSVALCLRDDFSALADPLPTETGDEVEYYGEWNPDVGDMEVVIFKAQTIGGPGSKNWQKWSAGVGKPATLRALVDKKFDHFEVRPKKEGSAFFPGELSGPQKIKANVKSLHMVWEDVDNGTLYEDTKRAALATPYFFILHPSHNFGTTLIYQTHAKYAKWCEGKGGKDTGYDRNEPTTPLVREFLRETTVYLDRVIDAAEFVEVDQIEGGPHLIIKTIPIEKHRIGFLLMEPVRRMDYLSRDREFELEWSEKQRGMGALVGAEIDEATTNLDRAYYFPSRTVNATPPKMVVRRDGRAVVWDEIERVKKRAAKSADPFAAAADDLDGSPSITTAAGINMKYWASANGEDRADYFDIAKAFLDSEMRDEIVFKEGGTGHLTVRCPIGDHPPKSGDFDPGCYVKSMDAGVEKMEFACSHQTCREAGGKDRLKMLCLAIEKGWIDESLLYHADYDLKPDREEASTGPEAKKAAEANVWEFVEQAKSAFATDGKLNWSLLGTIADALIILGPDGVVTKNQVWDALDEAFNASNRRPKLTLKKWDGLFTAAKEKQKSTGEDEKVTAPSKFGITEKDTNGKIKFDKKDGRYSVEDRWIFDKYAGKKGAFLCQEFLHDGYGVDERGENATHTISFQVLDEKSQKVRKQVSFTREELVAGTPVIQRLSSAGFQYGRDKKEYLLTLFNSLNYAPDTLLVSTSGWREDAFVYPDGTYAASPGNSRKLQLLASTHLSPYVKPTGSLQGWQEAVAPAFEGNAVGREHWAFGVIAGCAGTILGYFQPAGRYAFSLIGPSTRGKTEALRLMASVQGPIGTEGLFFDCDVTSNAPEAISHERSGFSIALDEVNKVDDPKTIKKVVWAETGTGKNRMTKVLGLGATKSFAGLLGLSNEHPVMTFLRNNRVSITVGADARFWEIDCSGVTKFDDDAFIKKMVRDATANHGHVLPVVIAKLQSMAPDEVRDRFNQCRAELIRPGMAPVEKRGLNPLVAVYLSGQMMQEAGVIPPADEFDVKRVIDWAIDNRCGDGKMTSEKEKAFAALRSAYVKHKGTRILDWSTIKATDHTPVAERRTAKVQDKDGKTFEEHYALDDAPISDRLPPVGYDYGEPGNDDVVIFLADEFAKLIGDDDVGLVLGYLDNEGWLVKTGRNRKWTKLPKKPHADNYRVRRAFFDHIEADEVCDNVSDGRDEPQMD